MDILEQQTIEQLVFDCYTTMLKREPSPAEIRQNTNHHKNLTSLLQAILKSAEFAAANRHIFGSSVHAGRPSRNDIVWAYQAFLGRDPESDAVIEAKLGHKSFADLILNMLASSEFRMKNPDVFALPDQWLLFDCPKGFRLWVNTADVGVSWQVMKGTYEPSEVAFIENTVKPGQTVADIGANIGYMTHIMAGAVGPKGRVISFEPHPVIFKQLDKSIRENRLEQCSAHNLALGATSGDGALSFGMDNANFGSMHLLSKGEAKTAKKVTVPIRPLCEIISAGTHVDFIKIDVEGHEPEVIAGAKDLLIQQKPVILSEILGHELQSRHGIKPVDYITLICDLGYNCHALNPNGKVGQILSDIGEIEHINVAFLPKH